MLVLLPRGGKTFWMSCVVLGAERGVAGVRHAAKAILSDDLTLAALLAAQRYA